MINSDTKPEILAPCGSYEILIAAVKAGADACYIGGNRFSARAYATNLLDDNLACAIDYAHLHDTKLYLTVNTLFKNNEIYELADYLMPYYKAGLDAVIVQDLGAFSLIKQYFPDLPIHCSTQMNIQSVHAAALMKEQGASRIVTAREMSLEEIRKIKETVAIEVETFVHGAMCYSYSGQCLMSSLAGGRSGNRGRCAQPCRKCYDNQYILSMKDLCSVTNIPALLDAKIDSFKIEGRMKNAYYVASTVDAYKELLDDAINGCFDMQKAQQYKKNLADIYNRGGFTDGYFFMHNAADMISKNRPNNQGTYVGTIKCVADGKVHIALSESIYKNDILEIPLTDKSFITITAPKAFSRKDTAIMAAPKTRKIAQGVKVYRTRCNVRLEQIQKDIIHSKKYKYIDITFQAVIGKPLTICVNECKNMPDNMKAPKDCPLPDNMIAQKDCPLPANIMLEDDIVERSLKAKPDIAQIKEKINQLGDTEYKLNTLSVFVDEDAFVPISKVKHMRREVLNQLEQKICKSYRREEPHIKHEIPPFSSCKPNSFDGYIAFVMTIHQLRAVVFHDKIMSICMDATLYKKAFADATLKEQLGKKNINICLPSIIDSHFDINAYLPNLSIHGIYIRNIDGLACVYNAYKKGQLDDKLSFITAASLYSYNDFAMSYYKQLLPTISFEAGYELNNRELSELNSKPSIALLYGHQQVMLSAQCINKSINKCNHNNDVCKITDDMSNDFYALCMCDGCYNIILNGRAYCMFDKEQELINASGAGMLALSFTIEDYEQTKEVLQYFESKALPQKYAKCYTNGHFYRGVE